MAVRQYIGARYVPKFSDVNGGVWDNTNEYEPLTIVKYNNDYYTSKKQVPVGIAITNNEYWILTGNYNGAISSLDDRVTALEGEWKTRKVLFVGDSYEGYYSGYSIAETIADALGIDTYQRVYGGGYGFSAEIDHPGNTWISLLQAATITIEPDTVIFYGGLNDEGATDLAAKMVEMNAYLKSTFPHLKDVYVAFIGFSFRDNISDRSNIRTACNTYRVKCSELGWHFLEGVEFIARDFKNFEGTSDTATYRHPSAAGVIKIAEGMTAALLDGCYDYENSYDITVTAGSNVTIGNLPLTLTYSIKNGIAYLDMVTANSITYTEAPVNNTGFDFGTLSVPIAVDSIRKNSRYWIATDSDVQYLGRIGINYSRTVRMVYEGMNVPGTSSLRLREIHENFAL